MFVKYISWQNRTVLVYPMILTFLPGTVIMFSWEVFECGLPLLQRAVI